MEVSIQAETLFSQNVIRHFAGQFEGIEVYAKDVVVSDNHLENLNGHAIRVHSSNVTVVGNDVLRCAGRQIAAIRVSGSGVLVEGNKVRDSLGDGVHVSGSNHIVLGNKVISSAHDGIVVTAGSGNEIRKNTVKYSGGEGLENRGTSTIAKGNVLWGNRLDVASTDPFEKFHGNDYKTGGTTTPPEFD